MEQLIPHTWFAGLAQWQLLAIMAGAMLVLVKAADWLVEGASGLAYRLGISKVIVGATIVSLGTTSPEAGVSVLAAWSGQSGLALGNAIGSIVADTGLIFGLGCLMARLPADAFVLRRQGRVQLGSGLLLAALCYGSWIAVPAAPVLGRWVGLLLLALLGVYFWISIRWARAHPHGEPFQDQAEQEIDAGSRSAVGPLVAAALFGLLFVLLASRTMILAVTELAEVHWMVPQVVIAATLVALGTSLPELVIGITSVLKGHGEILVGNVIGADILNVLFVVGASAAAAPLPLLDVGSRVPHLLFVLHLPAMVAILLLFRVFIYGACVRGHFRRWEGIPLVTAYVIYAVLQYVVA